MKFKKKYLPLIVGVAMAAGIYIGGKLNFSDTSDRIFTKNSKKDKLNRLIDYIDYEYIEDVNTDSIVDVTVNGILNTLDPHSVYIPKEDMERVADNMKGDFVGIGINFYTYKDTVTVIRTIDDGPSEKAGIRGGDRIIMANGDSIFGKDWSNNAIIKKLKGPINTLVDLKVYRRGEPELLDFKVKRNHIPIKSVDAAYKLTDKLGYIKVNRFAESTYKEFKKELNKLQKEGITELVLDLRGNPGGFLGVAEQIADEFLEKDKLILFTKNKRGDVEKSYATKKGDFENGRVFVLIDENSASASEIIAGALQDNDKGTIVGRRSYGKGLVQREMDLGDGSAVRLTVSRYYTPTGRSIQRSYDKGNKDYYQRFMERYHSGELVSVDSIKVADSLKFKTPKGKTVYGGGGIIPDVFVPIGSNELEAIESMNSGFLSYFVFEYLDENRENYKSYSKEDFINDYTVDDILFEVFIDYCLSQNIKMDFYAFEDRIKLYLKATLAEQLFDDNAYAQIKSGADDMVQKVLQLDRESRDGLHPSLPR